MAQVRVPLWVLDDHRYAGILSMMGMNGVMLRVYFRIA